MNTQIKKCTFEMLGDRGFDYNPNVDFSQDQFELLKSGVKYILKFVLHDYKSSQLKDIATSILQDNPNTELYLVVNNNTFSPKLPNLNVLYAKNLRINITKHVLTHKHELATESELDRLKEIGLKNLPIIYDTDPMVRWYGWKVGSVCKITRPNSTFYRMIKK